MAVMRTPRVGQRGLTGLHCGRRAAGAHEGGAGRGDVTAAPSPRRKPGSFSHLHLLGRWAWSRDRAPAPGATTDLGQALLLFSVRWGCIVLEFCPHLCGHGITSPTGWDLWRAGMVPTPLLQGARGYWVLITQRALRSSVSSTPLTAGDPGPGTQ